ncbi:2-dehydropantoate 2-reductase (Ketopantoate reductase) (KPA reductase) (KPR) [Microbotryomycetes sp. JL201]|nr:2-dehydropantoate 2-reductase (Ketopantoate reductase) (KPA reductase) (KPR) [Microbotryomycetes sp. JL201]
MRVHCLGVGSIGSLVAASLASSANPPLVRLILRKKALAAALAEVTPTSSPPGPSSSATLQSVPHVSLVIERDGLARRTSGLEVELLPSPSDLAEQTRLLPDGSPGGSARAIKSSTIETARLLRNDPISTLIVTTKATSMIPAIQPLLSRLSSNSTIVLCHNGMGVLETLLERFWPTDDTAPGQTSTYGNMGGRPNFICALTTHGMWRKGANHFVHAGMGDFKFGVLPNRAAQAVIAEAVGSAQARDNPVLNPKSVVKPTLEHIPVTNETMSLRQTINSLLSSQLRATWLPFQTLQIAQLQKLAVNASLNGLTALMQVHNGALASSPRSRQLVSTIARECADVFAAHLAYEDGSWHPENPHNERAAMLPDEHVLSHKSLTDYTMKVVRNSNRNVSSTLQDILSTTIDLDLLDTTSSSNSSSILTKPSSFSRTEVEYIHGYIQTLANKYRVRVPTVSTIGQLVLLKEELIKNGSVDALVNERLSKRAQGQDQQKSVAYDTTTASEKEGGTVARAQRRKKRYARAEKHLSTRAQRFERDRRIYDEKRAA